MFPTAAVGVLRERYAGRVLGPVQLPPHPGSVSIGDAGVKVVLDLVGGPRPAATPKAMLPTGAEHESAFRAQLLRLYPKQELRNGKGLKDQDR